MFTIRRLPDQNPLDILLSGMFTQRFVKLLPPLNDPDVGSKMNNKKDNFSRAFQEDQDKFHCFPINFLFCIFATFKIFERCFPGNALKRQTIFQILVLKVTEQVTRSASRNVKC